MDNQEYIGVANETIACPDCGKKQAIADVQLEWHDSLPIQIPVGKCFACGFLWSGAKAEEAIQKYTDTRMDIWKRVVKEPLFRFLKHDPVGRTILCLLANGQISHGKCAEAIVEKFCLGLDPVLPEWKGYSDAQE
jgi:hypothetical protein